MCGIAGIISENPNLEQMDKMLKIMRYRGPEGTFYARLNSNQKENALFGFLSLAFTDLAGGAQPMFNDNRDIFAVCNGEFYDYKQIKEDLCKKGHNFYTKSDSEISVHLYQEYGMDMFKHLNGEFAFAIYDSTRNKTIMARDRFGVKPLFYTINDGTLTFASECKALLALQNKREINHKYFNASGFASVENTITPFKNIHAVRPGHVAIWDGSEFTQKPYWQPEFNQTTDLSYDDAQKKMRELVLNGIQRRVDTNVAMATTLSGGLDSTIIAGLTQKEFGKDLTSFTLGYDDQKFSESPIAKLTADHFGVKLERIELSSEQLIERYYKSHWHSESITKDFSGAARQLLNQGIKDSNHKAVLSGEGPDELMGGYAYFRLSHIWDQMLAGGEKEITAKKAYEQFKIDEKKSEGLLWNKSNDWRKYKDTLGSPIYSSAFIPKAQKIRKHILSKNFVNKLQGTSLWDSYETEFGIDKLKSLSTFNKSRLISRSFFSSYIAPTLGDRSEMSACLEGRAPFLDLDVINFSYSLPVDYCLNPKTYQGKRIMYDAFSDIIPEHFSNIKKQPFRAPTTQSILKADGGRELYQDLISRKALKSSGIFNANTIGMIKLAWKIAPEDSSSFRQRDMDIGYFMSVQTLNHLFIDNFDKYADFSDLKYPMVEREWNFAY